MLNNSNTKKHFSEREIQKKFLEKVRRISHWQKKEQDRRSSRSRQKNKKGDRKVESDDSPEIPDRRETSDIPGLPYDDHHHHNQHHHYHRQYDSGQKNL